MGRSVDLPHKLSGGRGYHKTVSSNVSSLIFWPPFELYFSQTSTSIIITATTMNSCYSYEYWRLTLGIGGILTNALLTLKSGSAHSARPIAVSNGEREVLRYINVMRWSFQELKCMNSSYTFQDIFIQRYHSHSITKNMSSLCTLSFIHGSDFEPTSKIKVRNKQSTYSDFCSIEMRPTYATSHLFERALMIVLVFYLCDAAWLHLKANHVHSNCLYATRLNSFGMSRPAHSRCHPIQVRCVILFKMPSVFLTIILFFALLSSSEQFLLWRELHRTYYFVGLKMMPYQAVAMDYTGYQRQGPGVPGGHMGMGTLGMSVGGSPFTHSWLVPTQELCAVPYKQLPNQHQNTTMHSQQSLEPGHADFNECMKGMKYKFLEDSCFIAHKCNEASKNHKFDVSLSFTNEKLHLSPGKGLIKVLNYNYFVGIRLLVFGTKLKFPFNETMKQ
ncbi:Protein trachealess [Pseudolycoriella hygida]|uniref:Protein trachealess n=1 Tax=Pseudolycoriella hygida TaxID=35572 RepID=A0A9Q0MSE9_9DIPT|nr:Protein trachealess [Pseudolycoriella hygida]